MAALCHGDVHGLVPAGSGVDDSMIDQGILCEKNTGKRKDREQSGEHCSGLYQAAAISTIYVL